MKPLAKWISMAILAVCLTGCAGAEPFEYRSDTELKQGPGLFSGKDGAFEIYARPAEDETESSD